jgi:hypothetical protein
LGIQLALGNGALGNFGLTVLGPIIVACTFVR